LRVIARLAILSEIEMLRQGGEDRGGAQSAMGKGEGREDGVILHLGINEERGYFRQPAQPSS
jgi:hypothetical protein